MSLFKFLFPPLLPYHLICLLSQFFNHLFASFLFQSDSTIDSKSHRDRDYLYLSTIQSLGYSDAGCAQQIFDWMEDFEKLEADVSPKGAGT